LLKVFKVRLFFLRWRNVFFSLFFVDFSIKKALYKHG
jgi:hypothetical protein